MRLKSNEELHKLWYVLLKEKNRILSDKLFLIQTGNAFVQSKLLLKVRLSMSRLLTVVNE